MGTFFGFFKWDKNFKCIFVFYTLYIWWILWWRLYQPLLLYLYIVQTNKKKKKMMKEWLLCIGNVCKTNAVFFFVCFISWEIARCSHQFMVHQMQFFICIICTRPTFFVIGVVGLSQRIFLPIVNIHRIGFCFVLFHLQKKKTKTFWPDMRRRVKISRDSRCKHDVLESYTEKYS